MKNKNIISPVGLKGNQINERMKELMGISSINENKSNIVVELTKMGPDGKAYAIVRENHEYYIKSTTKTSGLIAEDFKYIGGLQNKKQEAYPSYAKAIKHLNLRFNSLSEAFNSDEKINTFLDDNLLAENGFAGGFQQHTSGFSGGGNLEGNSALYEEETEEEGEIDGLTEEEAKNNPWAICTASVGREDKEKYEACVTDVKKQKGIKEELVGNQDKLDADKDGDIEADDLADLRAKKDDKLDEIQQAVEDMLNESWMDEELTGNQDRIDMNKDGKLSDIDFEMLHNMEEGMYEEESEMGQQQQQQPISNAELWDMIDNMSATDFIQFLKDAGSDIKSKVMSMISSGADKTRDYLNQRYPENEGSLYEGKLSIKKAIDKMDALIDGLSDPKKKVKTQK
jgi:hypothetical protein